MSAPRLQFSKRSVAAAESRRPQLTQRCADMQSMHRCADTDARLPKNLERERRCAHEQRVEDGEDEQVQNMSVQGTGGRTTEEDQS